VCPLLKDKRFADFFRPLRMGVPPSAMVGKVELAGYNPAMLQGALDNPEALPSEFGIEDVSMSENEKDDVISEDEPEPEDSEDDDM
jgi:hypothetical protein